MSLNLVSLSSGSQGNCIAVFNETSCVLIDAGIGKNAILSWLKGAGFSNAAVLVTHSHSDHIGRLNQLTKSLNPDVFCHSSCFNQVEKKMAGGRLFAFDSDFYLGEFTISPFRASHDVPCVGYSIYCGGKKISIVTDTGCVTDDMITALTGSQMVFLEANHDENLLINNLNYPAYLKKRILSKGGHLSNSDSAFTAAQLAQSGTKQIILGHLSEENNYPELAYSAVSRSLIKCGIKPGKDVNIDVAGFNKVSSVFKLA